MNNATKSRIAKITTILCAVGIGILFLRIMPLGMSGDIAQSKPYIILAVILFLVGVPAAIIYLMYKAKSDESDQELARMHAELDMLAHSGTKLHTENHDNTRE